MTLKQAKTASASYRIHHPTPERRMIYAAIQETVTIASYRQQPQATNRTAAGSSAAFGAQRMRTPRPALDPPTLTNENLGLFSRKQSGRGVKFQVKDTCGFMDCCLMKYRRPIYDSKMCISRFTLLLVHLGHCVATDVSDAGKGRQSGWHTA